MVYSAATATYPLHSFTIVPKGGYGESDLFDASLLRAARVIYQAYCETQPDIIHRPTGVALHRETYRGKPVFTKRPILLPGEMFVPIAQIESELY